jgi:hypothetical protein
MNTEWKTPFAESLVKAWENAGVMYAIANGLETYPDGPVGRDLDVLVAPADLRRAVTVTLDYCRTQECDAVVQRLGWIYWIMIVAKTPEGIRSIQVDLFAHLQWEFSWILDGRHLEGRKRRGVFFTDPWSHVAKRLLINLLSAGPRVFEARSHYLKATDEELETFDLNIVRLAGRPFPELTDAVRARGLSQLASLAPKLRKSIRFQGLAAPGFLSRLRSAWQKQWAVNVWPRRAAPVIALNGRLDPYFKRLAGEFARRFQEAFVYCAIHVVSPMEEASPPSWLSWWKRELRGDRRRSALQVVNIYENHALGCALFAGVSRLSGWLVRTSPRPDLNLLLATCDGDREAGAHWQSRGVVDRVFNLTGDLSADLSALLEAVFDWHREKAAIQRARWDLGRL